MTLKVRFIGCTHAVVNVKELDCMLQCSRHEVKDGTDFVEQEFHELNALEIVFLFQLSFRSYLKVKPGLFFGGNG